MSLFFVSMRLASLCRLAPPQAACGLLAVCTALVLNACTTAGPPETRAATDDAAIEAAWVQLVDGNRALARVIVRPSAGGTTAACPMLIADGIALPMTVRAAAGTGPVRPVVAGADDTPPAFPVTVCERLLAPDMRAATVGGRALALPRAEPRRVLVIGDSGCRLKQGAPAQACNDPREWPFPTVAANAARLAPDLVIHLGDYHYRESPCPPGKSGCTGSPYGYGWAAWKADFFAPAAPLLAAAPWVMLRGNHEECRRAGQGWYRFLDPRPWQRGLACDDAARDPTADHGEPYALMLGADTQLVVFDSARAGMRPLQAGSPGHAAYTRQFGQVADLAARRGIRATWFASHHPVLAFNPEPGDGQPTGNLALQSVMAPLFGPAYYPPGITLALHGHAHSFQAVDFASDHPAALVSGNAGDLLDEALPPMAGLAPAPGTRVARLSYGHHFGFALLERGDGAHATWQAAVFDVSGRLLTRCTLAGRRLVCDRDGRLDR